MGDQGQLTNVPDYQKIRQTSQGGAGSGGEQHSGESLSSATIFVHFKVNLCREKYRPKAPDLYCATLPMTYEFLASLTQ